MFRNPYYWNPYTHKHTHKHTNCISEARPPFAFLTSNHLQICTGKNWEANELVWVLFFYSLKSKLVNPMDLQRQRFESMLNHLKHMLKKEKQVGCSVPKRIMGIFSVLCRGDTLLAGGPPWQTPAISRDQPVLCEGKCYVCNKAGLTVTLHICPLCVTWGTTFQEKTWNGSTDKWCSTALCVWAYIEYMANTSPWWMMPIMQLATFILFIFRWQCRGHTIPVEFCACST